MAEGKKRIKRERQQWRPPLLLSLLQKAWMVAFGLFKIALGAAATVAMIVGICGLVFAGILGDYLQTDVAPNAMVDIESIILDQTSHIYYVDSSNNIQVLQEIYTDVDRQWADIDDIPEDLCHAAVAIEDQRFYEHQGVDWITTIKAFARMFFGDDASVGGSTITQQLIKNSLQEDDVTIQRKIMEMFRATQLEKEYDKRFIMERYLNTIFLGEDCYGVRSAAEHYFGKPLQALTLAECASLISITNNPSLYDPYIQPTNNRNRQVDILWTMREQGWITEAEYQQALSQELVSKSVMDRLLNAEEITQEDYDSVYESGLVSHPILEKIAADGVVTQEEYDQVLSENTILKKGVSFLDQWAECTACGYEGANRTLSETDGLYYCPNCGTQIEVAEDATQEMYSFFVDTVLQDVAAAFAEKDGKVWSELDDEARNVYHSKIRHGGYNIYSTINMEVQQKIDRIYEDLDEIPETRSGQQLQSAIVIIDNRTGDIVGLSGGVGEKTNYLAWSRATDSRLQTGSSIKPLSVYGPAFEKGGFSPATVVKDLPVNYYDGPYPKNDNNRYSYRRTIHSAIVDSVNAAAANTLQLIGLNYSFNFAKQQFGLQGLVEEYVNSAGSVFSDLDIGPLALGAQSRGVTVRDMATAFATFPNNGTYRKARTYTKVYDSQGNLVLDNTQETREILSQETVNYIHYCLHDAATDGTGEPALFDSSVSKVSIYGKTGSTGNYFDRWFCGYTGYYTAAVWCGYDTPERINPVGDSRNVAARLWKKVMQPIHAGLSDINLVDTSGMKWVNVCLESGKLATDACRQDIRSDYSPISERVPCYPEDAPTEECDAHILVDYCTTGGGVATEYCKKFAEVGSAEITQKALVKMTVANLEEIRKAADYRLSSAYLRDDYIYLINEDGTDAVFKGINNNINQNVDAPYQVCTVHTQAAWEEYENAHQPTQPEDPGPFWPFW